MSSVDRPWRAILVVVAVVSVPLVMDLPAAESDERRDAGRHLVLHPIAPDPALDSGVSVVEIDGIQFLPKTVTIRAGETIEWRNSSKLGHTVTADPEKAASPDHVRLPEGAETFDSGNLAPGDAYSRTFEVPGVYEYFCIPHGAAGMVGTIAVKPAESEKTKEE